LGERDMKVKKKYLIPID